MNSQTAEVLVIGGGPAGSALSLRLARAGCPVVMVERTAYQEFRSGESLPPSAVPRLADLGIWQSFLATGAEPAYGIKSAWGTSDIDSSSFLANPSSNGWHLDRRSFDALLSSAAEAAGVRVVSGMRFGSSERCPQNMWSVRAAASAGGELSLRARFVVDASGRAAHFCTQLGIRRRKADCLIGIASIFTDKSFPASLPSLVESHPLGWWYSAGLPGGGAVLIFFTDADISARHDLARSAWRRILAESVHTRARFSPAFPTRPLKVFHAGSHCLEQACGESWIAVGDAVIGRDPLSSSGIDFALASAERGAAVLLALANGRRASASSYNQAIRDDFAAYLNQRHAYYCMENRWPDSLFWQRRHLQRREATISSILE